MYSIDSSAIRDGWVRYYPPDVFGSVWERLKGLGNNGTLFTPDEVVEELKKKEDGAWKWAIVEVLTERDAFLQEMSCERGNKKASRVMILEGLRSSRTISMMRRPDISASAIRRESAAGIAALPGRVMPSVSAMDAIVDAVASWILWYPNFRCDRTRCFILSAEGEIRERRGDGVRDTA